MPGIRPALCLLCLLHKENSNNNVLRHEDIRRFICNVFCLKFFSAYVLSFLYVSESLFNTVSWNVSSYLRSMLKHVNFKCYELSTFSFNCLIIFFTRINGCWRQRCQYRGVGFNIPPPKHFPPCCNRVTNVVSE
jgi:hypothetical protein